MSHQSIDANVWKTIECFTEFRNFVRPHSQPSHSCVDFHVNIHDCVRFAGREIERFDHIETINNRREMFAQASRFLAAPKSAETKNWPRNSGLPSLDSFFR